METTWILFHIIVVVQFTSVFTTKTSGPDIRLVDGDTPFSGRVEIKVGNKFATICDDGWDSREAEVVCRQLGYATGNVRAYHCSQYGNPSPSTSIAYRRFDCTGDELTLMDCAYQDAGNNCNHVEDVGVDCDAPGSDQDLVRLVNGITPNVGKLQWRINNTSPEWGTICSDTPWGINEATVACRQLGFSPGFSYAFTAGVLSNDPAKIWFSDIACDGSEDNLMQCSLNNGARCLGLAVACNHSSDVGLICDSGSSEIITSSSSLSPSSSNTSSAETTTRSAMSMLNSLMSTSNLVMSTSSSVVESTSSSANSTTASSAMSTTNSAKSTTNSANSTSSSANSTSSSANPTITSSAMSTPNSSKSTTSSANSTSSFVNSTSSSANPTTLSSAMSISNSAVTTSNSMMATSNYVIPNTSSMMSISNAAESTTIDTASTTNYTMSISNAEESTTIDAVSTTNYTMSISNAEESTTIDAVSTTNYTMSISNAEESTTIDAVSTTNYTVLITSSVGSPSSHQKPIHFNIKFNSTFQEETRQSVHGKYTSNSAFTESDKRASAAALGSLAIMILVTSIVIVVAADGRMLYLHFKKMWRNINKGLCMHKV